MNSEHDRQWVEQLEAGIESDELLALAARLRQAGEATRATPSLAFQRQLRRDLMNGFESKSRRPARLGQWLGSAAALALLALVVGLTWLSMSSAGRSTPAGAATTAAESGYHFLGYSTTGGTITEQVTEQTETGETVSQTETHLLVPGQTMTVTLRWSMSPHWSLSPDATGVAAFVHLMDSDGQLVAQADAPVLAAIEPTDQPNAATLFLNLPVDLPSGEYELVAGLYELLDGSGGARLPVTTEKGQSTSVSLGRYQAPAPAIQGQFDVKPLNDGRFEVEPRREGTGIESATVIVPPPPEDTLYLKSYSYSAPEGLTPGEPLEFTGRWRIPAGTNGADVLAFVHLRDQNGAIVAQADGPLTLESLTAFAGSGEAWAFQLPLPLPDDLPSGEYLLVTGLLGADGQRLPVYDLTVGDEIVIGPVTLGQAAISDAKLTILDVSPAAGAVLSGTQTITFTVRLAYDAVAAPAILEVKINEIVGASGRGVATAQVTLDSASGEVTVPVVLYPARELSAPAELGLWFQLRATADAPPQLIAMPEAYRWRYTP
jgi:hypothetical protein